MCVRAAGGLCLRAFWWPRELWFLHAGCEVCMPEGLLQPRAVWFLINACSGTFQYVHMYSAQEEEICSGLYIQQT